MTFALVAVASLLFVPQDDAAKKKQFEKELEKVEAEIKKKPDDPDAHHRKAQCLMKLERFDDGYEAARQAMELFIKKDDDRAALLLESIDFGHVRVDVHFNMGPGERKPPDRGIIRPLTFRVWASADKGGEAKERAAFDLEYSLGGGKPITAAFGVTRITEGRYLHSNLGMLEVTSSYRDIRGKAVDLVKRRHPEPDKEKKEPEDK